MTLGRFSILLTVLLVAVPFALTLATGNAMLTFWILLAPVPSWLAYRSDYHDWTVRDAVDRWAGEDPLEAELDAALRPPVPTPGLPEDDAFFVPDCPPLR